MNHLPVSFNSVFFLLCHKSLFNASFGYSQRKMNLIHTVALKFCLACLLVLLTGCMKYKIPTESLPYPNESLDHPLYEIIPRHRCQLAWYDVGHWTSWMIFGNDDDGIFGEPANYHEKQSPGLKKALAWQLRNPLHNFCFYVIGSAQRQNSEFDLLKIGQGKVEGMQYRGSGQNNFPYESSCFYLALHGGKPFVSLRLVYTPKYRSEFYIGWRERGNFGIKLLPIKKC